MRVDAVLFDLDGTLLDSYALISESFTYACRHVLNRDLTQEDVLERWGAPLHVRFEGVDPARIDDLISAYIAYYEAHQDRHLSLFPGVREMLEALKDRRVRMAIVTSKRRYTTGLTVRKFSLEPYFGAVISEQDVAAPKPAPDPVFAALRQLEVAPAQALMVGDGVFDIRAARAAGVAGAAALWGTHEMDALLASGADYAVPTPADVLALIDAIL
jgi:pyrophosphatase PpaX